MLKAITILFSISILILGCKTVPVSSSGRGNTSGPGETQTSPSPTPSATPSPSASPTPTPSTSPVASGCLNPYGKTPGHTFYIDPLHGSNSGNGSSINPWHTLAEVVNAGLISSRSYSAQPYNSNLTLVPRNPSGIIHSGDLIYLLSGNHGDVYFDGYFNTDFITIQNAPGNTPVLNSLRFDGGSKWLIRGLTIQATNGNNLVNLFNSDWFGPGDNFVVDGNTLQSQANVDSWTQTDWQNQGANLAIRNEATCSTITNNTIKNIRYGIAAYAANELIQNNTIDNFGDDGIDVCNHDISIIGNTITNNRNIADSYHNDAIQMYRLDGVTMTNTVIDKNIILVSTHANLPFRGDMQGITDFDGVWDGVQVTNNVVYAGIYHGIALYGAKNALIMNNTVESDNAADSYESWIGVFDGSSGTESGPSVNNTVRNNIAPYYVYNTTGVIKDHNVTTTDPTTEFVKFDRTHYQFDFHLKAGSDAIGAGSNGTGMGFSFLLLDVIGTRRASSGAWDAGAYAY